MRIIDAKHNQAIRREIGERLQGFLRVQPDVPPHLRELVRQFEGDYRVLPDQNFSTRLSARIARLRAGLVPNVPSLLCFHLQKLNRT